MNLVNGFPKIFMHCKQKSTKIANKSKMRQLLAHSSCLLTCENVILTAMAQTLQAASQLIALITFHVHTDFFVWSCGTLLW